MAYENTKKIEKDGKIIYLIGTAHVLKESAEEVNQVLNEVNPDTVCVELCEARINNIKENNKWQNLDIVEVIKSGKGYLLLANMILTAFQQKAGIELDSKPGEEMLVAISYAENHSKNLVLADRDVNITLKRVWALASFKERLRILEMLLDSLFFGEEIKKEEIKDIMKGENLFTEMLKIFSQKLPVAKKVLIDERNEYIANKILNSNGNVICAIVGKGHLDGIAELIEKGLNYNYEIETLPDVKDYSKLIGWIILILILGLFILGFIFKGKTTMVSMIGVWILVTGFLTSTFALISLPHPITYIASWFVPAFTILNPTVGAGIVLAIIEAYFNKPKVSDFENISKDIMSIKGFYKNKITKILLVFFLTSIGASLGTFVGIPFVVNLLK